MLVTIITPTTIDREHFNERLRSIFLGQDYPHIEHLFDYEPGSIGVKRNRLCELAKGEIILHGDSDDWYASDWVSKSVVALQQSGKQLTGLSTFNFYSPDLNKKYQYIYPPHENMAGATFCYYKSLWQDNPFKDMNVGEDNLFIRKQSFAPHDYVDGFLATIHKGNTSPKNISGERWVEL